MPLNNLIPELSTPRIFPKDVSAITNWVPAPTAARAKKLAGPQLESTTQNFFQRVEATS
jgi:hypothetical protein